MNRREQKQLQAEQMRFPRPLLDLTTLDKPRNVDIRNKLKQNNTVGEIKKYKKKIGLNA